MRTNYSLCSFECVSFPLPVENQSTCDECLHHAKIPIQDRNIGICSGYQPTLVLEFECACGVLRQCCHCLFERSAGPSDEVSECNFLCQCASGKAPVDVSADTVHDLYHIRTKSILAVRHIRRADRISDQHNAVFALGSREQSHDGGIDVDSIGDDLRKNAIVCQYLASDTWFAMRKCAHRIERMNGITDATIHGSAGLCKGRVRMTHRHSHIQVFGHH